MILPGHIAASWLCQRCLRADLRVALVAGLFPDLLDKPLYYLSGLTPNSRIPGHTLLGWLVSSAIVLALGWLIARAWVWGWSWGVAYAGHLLCDSPLVGDQMPFLWPWRAYPFTTAPDLWSYFLHIDRELLYLLAVETALVLAALLVELRRRRRAALSEARR